MQRIKVGDWVHVTAGRSKGKEGKVMRLSLEDDRVWLEGVHKVTRHQKPTNRDPQGGRIEKEAPLHLSNVMPVDAVTGKPTRVKTQVTEDDTKRRISVAGNELKTG